MFTLFCDGQELNVSDSDVLLRMPLNNDASTRSACVGQPNGRAMFEHMRDFGDQCHKALECRYWAEELHDWSTRGCVTEQLDGGAMGCRCSHLSDFIAVQVGALWPRRQATSPAAQAFADVNLHPPSASPFTLRQVPTGFDGEIEFAQLDVDTAVTLHCACTRGVEVVLQKELTGIPDTILVSIPLQVSAVVALLLSIISSALPGTAPVRSSSGTKTTRERPMTIIIVIRSSMRELRIIMKMRDL